MSDLGFPSRRHPFFQAMRPAVSTEPTALNEADLDRVLPRHFPLSIPGDVCPGIPTETSAHPIDRTTPLVDSAD